MGEDIVCFKLGGGNNKILIHGGIHAREYITTLLLLKEIEYLKQFYLNTTFYIIPIINVDGVRLVLNGKIKNKKQMNKIVKINAGDDFSLFKANANGVDLNVNFDALWGEGVCNVKSPASANYIGDRPNSEPESSCLVEFVEKIHPNLTISYHAKGEVVYFGFKHLKIPFSIKQKVFAKRISKHLNYKKLKAKGSTGGFKDFCLLKHQISSFTIEVGTDKMEHPFPVEELGVIFDQNKNLPLFLQRIV